MSRYRKITSPFFYCGCREIYSMNNPPFFPRLRNGNSIFSSGNPKVSVHIYGNISKILKNYNYDDQYYAFDNSDTNIFFVLYPLNDKICRLNIYDKNKYKKEITNFEQYCLLKCSLPKDKSNVSLYVVSTEKDGMYDIKFTVLDNGGLDSLYWIKVRVGENNEKIQEKVDIVNHFVKKSKRKYLLDNKRILITTPDDFFFILDGGIFQSTLNGLIIYKYFPIVNGKETRIKNFKIIRDQVGDYYLSCNDESIFFRVPKERNEILEGVVGEYSMIEYKCNRIFVNFKYSTFVASRIIFPSLQYRISEMK